MWYFKFDVVNVFVALTFITCCLTEMAHAQALEVSPISIEFQPDQMTTTLSVTNQGREPTVLQMRPFQWDQANNSDQLTATVDLLVSPPITNVPAGESQTFRLVLERPANETETSYRLLLDQLPAPAMAGTVRIALRISIPVFAEPQQQVYPDLDWRIETLGNGDVLVVANHGTKHARILNPVLVESNGRKIKLLPGQTPYILPGAERRWSFGSKNHPIPGSTVHLIAMSDAGLVDATVHVFAP
jgi:fimbrial chaperone protein